MNSKSQKNVSIFSSVLFDLKGLKPKHNCKAVLLEAFTLDECVHFSRSSTNVIGQWLEYFTQPSPDAFK